MKNLNEFINGSLQPMKDEFINIVEKATKLQRKMKF